MRVAQLQTSRGAVQLLEQQQEGEMINMSITRQTHFLPLNFKSMCNVVRFLTGFPVKCNFPCCLCQQQKHECAMSSVCSEHHTGTKLFVSRRRGSNLKLVKEVCNQEHTSCLSHVGRHAKLRILNKYTLPNHVYVHKISLCRQLWSKLLTI